MIISNFSKFSLFIFYFYCSGNEFDVHIKCVSEDQRYAAKGSSIVTAKKGEVKQESWVEMIRSIIKEEQDLKPSHRNLLNRISSYNNVPRKKPKFMVIKRTRNYNSSFMIFLL